MCICTNDFLAWPFKQNLLDLGGFWLKLELVNIKFLMILYLSAFLAKFLSFWEISKKKTLKIFCSLKILNFSDGKFINMICSILIYIFI